jgi:hypothetical protein
MAQLNMTTALSKGAEMRIAVLGIGLVLGIVMVIQTVLIAGLNSAVADDNASTTETVGSVMAMMWLVL